MTPRAEEPPPDCAYSSNAYFDLPPMTAKEKREERKYMHVTEDM